MALLVRNVSGAFEKRAPERYVLGYRGANTVTESFTERGRGCTPSYGLI